MIDLRSDTVTKPTPEMLQAMMQAEVGDDVFGEDPTIALLEKKSAAYFGMEAGIFCPSGTMTNQIAIRLHTQPQHEVICDRLSHIYNYEGGGIAYNSMASVRLLYGDLGRLKADDIRDNINNPHDIHAAPTAMVGLENTVNKGGGCYYDLHDVAEISKLCKEEGLKLHLDGARLFNALVASEDHPLKYGEYFDTISICLSKGLGTPVGSVLLGSKETITRAKRVRKVLGGGMRQAGFLAAAGIYALDNHIHRLADDHERARKIAAMLNNQPYVQEIKPVHTNIVIFTLKDVSPAAFASRMKEQGVQVIPFGKKDIRMVTHLDFKEEDLNVIESALNNLAVVHV
jgi:threonine aldolase